MKALPFGGQST